MPEAPTLPNARGLVVLGVDPGSRCMGYGLVREASGKLELVEAGTVRPPTNGDIAGRLGEIHRRLAAILAAHRPDEAAVEAVFGAANLSSALKLGQARGAALAAIGGAGVPVFEYEPTRVKKAIVGAGRAEKSQVAFMVERLLGGLPKALAVDATDALAMAICHLNERRLARLTAKAATSNGQGRAP